jgi:hypothetical protein
MMGGMKDRPAPPPHTKNLLNIAAGNYPQIPHSLKALFCMSEFISITIQRVSNVPFSVLMIMCFFY